VGKVMAHPAKPYAAVPTLFDRVQDELTAIDQITRVLGSLPDHDTRVRVIKWINDRFANGFQDPQAQTMPAVALVSPSPERASDSGLSFPDDLFESPGTREPADLHGIFDHPASKPHAFDWNGILEPRREQVIDFVFERPHAPAVEPEEDAFELVPPAEASSAELANEADAEPAWPIDRRQLTLLLLTNVTPPAAPSVPEPPRPGEGVGESPTPELATRPAERHESSARNTSPSGPGEPAQDTMETMLRSLVADFRQLADEWGNT
jgi:hypothetical protein